VRHAVTMTRQLTVDSQFGSHTHRGRVPRQLCVADELMTVIYVNH